MVQNPFVNIWNDGITSRSKWTLAIINLNSVKHGSKYRTIHDTNRTIRNDSTTPRYESFDESFLFLYRVRIVRFGLRIA